MYFIVTYYIANLRRGNDDNAIGGRRPNEIATLQPLGVERHAQGIVPKNLYQIAATTPENIQIASVGIALQYLLHLQGKRVHPTPHIRVACGDPYPNTRRNGDH